MPGVPVGRFRWLPRGPISRCSRRRSRSLGVKRDSVWRQLYSGRKSWWALSHTHAVDQGLRNAYFAKRGLIFLVASVRGGGTTSSLSCAGLVNNSNGKTLTMTLRHALVTGAVNRVPVIAGNGRDEDVVSNETGVALPHTASDYTSLVDAQYGKLAPRVLALYPLERFPSP
jgi:hypothetical protein